LVLTLLCLFFRVPAYHYVLGGQDEGVYVNMAHHIARTGGIAVRDTAMEQLGEPSLVATYIKDNHGAAYLPGIYLDSQQSSALTFQFYHLFPVWMAFFEGLFGAMAAVYALTFFSWLSVVFIYRLALAVSGSGMAAFVAGALLALNPLHAFFSKFPVTEVPALTFSLIGFAYLALFRQRADRHHFWHYLWISVASFGCLFATRISGFMYMPFVVAAAMASAIGDSGHERRRGMFLWGASVTLLYAVSVWYGLRWSSNYSNDIYRLSFEPIFHAHWRAVVAVCVTMGLVAWFAVVVASRQPRLRERLLRYLSLLLRFALVGAVLGGLLVGLYKIYGLGWTNRFLDDPWLGQRWHLAGARWESAKATSLFALAAYLGPLLPAGIIALLVRKKKPQVEFLRLFAAGFFLYAILLQWTVPYGPYYARYLLSEVVPYLSLLVVLSWAAMEDNGWKKATGALIGVSMLYMAIASAAQIGKVENKGVYQTLKGLLAPVDSGDLVLMGQLGPGWPAVSQIKTPVVYAFGHHVVTVSDESLHDPAYISALNEHFDDVFLLSTSSTAPREFELVDSATLEVWTYRRSHMYPSDFGMSVKKRLYLYRMVRTVFPLFRARGFGSKGSWDQWLVSGWSAPESWGTWTAARYAEIKMDPRELPNAPGGIQLRFQANVLVNARHPHQRVKVTLNGASVVSYDATYPASSITINVPVSAEVISRARMLMIGFELPDAVAPKDIGLGDDGRLLAIGLTSLTAYPLGDEPSAKVPNDSPSLDGKR
jgi:hypothetical protein